MARQNGPIIWEKTFGIVSFYRRGDRGYVRMKSNLTAERWRTDPAFEGSRKCADNMANSSRLASVHYRVIPDHQRCYPFYHRLVGIAQEMFCAGFSAHHVEKVLAFTVHQYLRKLERNNQQERRPVRSSFTATHSFEASPTFNPAAPKQCSNQPLHATALNSRPIVFHPANTTPIRGRPYKQSLQSYLYLTILINSHPNGRANHVPTRHFRLPSLQIPNFPFKKTPSFLFPETRLQKTPPKKHLRRTTLYLTTIDIPRA